MTCRRENATVKHLSSPQSGAHYTLLGPAFKTNNLWLARHQASQKLVLVQSFANSNPALPHLLAGQHDCMPRVLDSWVSQGRTYVVLERVDGPDVEQIGLGVLRSDTKAQLRSLLSLLARLGWRLQSSRSICLDAYGRLRLRWFPSLSSENSRQAA